MLKAAPRLRLSRQIADVRERLEAAFDRAYFLSVAATLIGKGVETSDPLDLYLSDEIFRLIDPNRFFDESYYRHTNPDVAAEIHAGTFVSGLHHYVAHGAEEWRLPNPDFAARMESASVGAPPRARSPAEADAAIAGSGELRAFHALFSFLSRLELYDRLGRFLVSRDGLAFRRVVEERFDPAFYRQQARLPDQLSDDELVEHYLRTGCRRGLSPHRDFDEAFYVAFYDDVRDAVEGGHSRLTCGYEHYVLTGRREGRMPVHRLGPALEARVAGITEPTGLARLGELENALAPPKVVATRRTERVVHVLVPDLNPDIFFGGYRTLVELMKHLARRGHTLSILKTGRDGDGLHYFLYHESDPQVRALFAKVPAHGRATGLTVARNDRFIAFSGWDALLAAQLLRHTNAERFAFLVQEYEPIFADHNAHRFMLEAAYATPHFPVFNSAALAGYFRSNGIGVFAQEGGSEGHAVFEHVLTAPAAAPLDTERSSKPRTFLLYARPEGHAGRNLFEIAVLALRAALERVDLARSWDFVGVGALSELPDVALSGSHRLRLLPRMDGAGYARLLRGAHAGLSLMYAPHPSLVPFELAQAGALVVTNVYSNRDEAFLTGISSNIVPASLTLESITDRLVDVLRAADRRTAKTCQHFCGHWPASWEEACETIATRLVAEDLV